VWTSAIEVPEQPAAGMTARRRWRVIRALGVKNLQLYADAPRGARAAGKQQRGEHNEKQQSD